MAKAVPYFSNLEANSLQFKPKLQHSSLSKSGSVYFKPTVTGFGIPLNKNRPFKTRQPSPSPYSSVSKGILEEAETSSILDKQFEENNRSSFLNLASTETLQTLSKFAEKRARGLNPLTGNGKKCVKKRKLDIFD